MFRSVPPYHQAFPTGHKSSWHELTKKSLSLSRARAALLATTLQTSHLVTTLALRTAARYLARSPSRAPAAAAPRA